MQCSAVKCSAVYVGIEVQCGAVSCYVVQCIAVSCKEADHRIIQTCALSDLDMMLENVLTNSRTLWSFPTQVLDRLLADLNRIIVNIQPTAGVIGCKVRVGGGP